MTVKVRLKRNYGREDFYPENELAQAILEMMGKKVFRTRHIDTLRKHKVSVEVQDEIRGID